MRARFLSMIAATAICCSAAPSLADDLTTILKDYASFTEKNAGRDDEDGNGALTAWPDNSPAGISAQRTGLARFGARLKAIPATSLSAEEQVTAKLLARAVAMEIEGIDFDEDRIPFTGGEGFYTRPYGQARNTVFKNRAEAESYIHRMEALPTFYAQAMTNMRRGLATGFIQPKLTAEVALRTAKTIAGQPATADEPLLIPFRKLPATIPAAEAEALRARAIDVLARKIKPAQADVATFFETVYIPKARASIGARDMKNGDKYYAYLVRKYTTTEMTPEQVHALGLSEVKRIRAEMDAAVARMGFKGDARAFIVDLGTKAEWRAKSNQDYFEKAGEILKRIDWELPRYFGKLPRLTYGIKNKSPDQANSSAAYYRGDPELGIAGTVMTGLDQTGYPLYNLPAWLLHEGVPGHHLQVALGQERLDLPVFRRASGSTAFAEGWALYAERLGEEMGIYRNDHERFGKLAFEIWRACRLVVDTGMHMKGWTRAQGVACLTDNTSLPQRSAEREVDRYIGWPGQALSYKIGELKISEIRARAEKELGPKFDIRKFHDAMIDDGPLPMAILEEQMNKWIATQKAAN